MPNVGFTERAASEDTVFAGGQAELQRTVAVVRILPCWRVGVRGVSIGGQGAHDTQSLQRKN